MGTLHPGESETSFPDGSGTQGSRHRERTTVPHIGTHLLPPALPALRQRHPGLVLEVVADERAFNLSRREADLALRVGRLRDSGLVVRRLSGLNDAFYAAASTDAGSRGAVNLVSDPFLGEQPADVTQERWLDRTVPDRRVVHRCNSTVSLLAGARHGLRVALLPCHLGDAESVLRRLEGPEPVADELWLLVQGDLRRTPRVRAVIGWMDELIANAQPALLGRR